MVQRPSRARFTATGHCQRGGHELEQTIVGPFGAGTSNGINTIHLAFKDLLTGCDTNALRQCIQLSLAARGY